MANFHGEQAILRSKDDQRCLLRAVVLWERTLGKYYRVYDPEFHQKLVNFLSTECSNIGSSGVCYSLYIYLIPILLTKFVTVAFD